MSRAYKWEEDKISELEQRIEALEAEREKLPTPPNTRRRSKICTICGAKHPTYDLKKQRKKL